MKTRTLSTFAILMAGALILTGCNNSENSNESMEIANPASVYCEENGWTLVLEDGAWLCMFEDGSYCEEWSFKNGECQPWYIMYNTLDQEYIGDVEIKTDWNGSSETYSDEDLQAAVDTIMNTVNNERQVKIEMKELFYQWDEESSNQLSYCKELNSEVDECVFFKTNFYIPEQDAVMAWAFEPNTTLTDYEWYLGRSNGGEWSVLTSGY